MLLPESLGEFVNLPLNDFLPTLFLSFGSSNSRIVLREQIQNLGLLTVELAVLIVYPRDHSTGIQYVRSKVTELRQKEIGERSLLPAELL